MIGKGNTHGDGVKLARYLLEPGTGERTELLDMRGLGVHGDPVEGFREQAELAEQTKAEKPFFHVQMRGAAEELKNLTRDQILEIVDGCDTALGRAMTQQPRMASLHIDEKTGDFHIHVAYSLVTKAEDGHYFVQRLGKYENKLQLYAREVEQKYGLQILSNEPQPGARRADRNELEESRRLGTDLKEIRNSILDCLEHADSGKAFKAALEDRNLMLANGDQRNCFVVIDEASGHHALNKKLTGMTLAEIRDRFADLDRTQLPSVDQAQAMQRERHQQREIDHAAEQAMQAARAAAQGRKDEIRPDRYAELDRQAGQTMQEAHAAAKGRTDDIRPNPQPEIRPLGKTAGEIRLAWQLTKTADQFAQALEDKGLILVHVSRDEAEASHRAHDFAKAVDRQSRELREGFAVVDERGNVTRIDQRTTGDHLEEIRKRIDGIDTGELASVAEARAIMAERRHAEWIEKKEAERAQERINEPVTGARADIRVAWSLSRSDDQLEEALAARGFGMARVTEAEAYESERRNAFAREVGNRATVLKEGEIVAVNGFGNVYRFDERSTGQLRDEIEARLAGIHAAELPSVTDAKDIMREASRAAWAEQQEQARSASWIESRIADIADQARINGADAYIDREGKLASQAEVLADRFRPADEPQIHSLRVYGTTAFETRLDEAGIAAARVTEADIKALAALRHDESMSRTASDTSNEARKPHHFAADLAIGELVAVTRDGDVYRLNPDKTGDAKQHLTGDLPSVVEARSYFEREREQISALWQERRTDAANARQDFAAEREAAHQAAETARDLRQFNQEISTAADTGERAASGIARGAADIAEKALGILDDLFFSGPPPTRDQAERAARSAEEKHQERADHAAHAERTEAQHWLIEEARRRAAEKERGASPESERPREPDRGYERERF